MISHWKPVTDIQTTLFNILIKFRESTEKKVWNFFCNFPLIPRSSSELQSGRKRDSNSQKCHKIRDLKTRTRQKYTKSNSMVRRYSEEHLEFFFRIFRSYPAPVVGLKVEKTRFHLLKHRETFVLRRKVGKTEFINISYQYNYIEFLGQTRKLKKKTKKTKKFYVIALHSNLWPAILHDCTRHVCADSRFDAT